MSGPTVSLGSLPEARLRRTLLVSDGNRTALVERPFMPGLIARLRGQRFERKGFAEEDSGRRRP